MRISSLTIFDQSVSSINRQQGEFLKVGQQIASQRRVVNPSDDPQAASRAVGVSQAKAVTAQYADARISARNSLSQEESILHSIGDAIASAKTLIIQGASDTLSDPDRASIASELRGIMETVLGQANATDGNGRYLFGGYKDASPPFNRDPNGAVIYDGDSNTREQRIDASRLMPVADNGAAIFQNVHSSAGYVAQADAANAGTVTFTGPRVADATAANYGDTFTITFAEVAGNLEYTIMGQAVGTPPPAPYAVVSNEPYVPGIPVSFGGLALTLDGVPEDGDIITTGRATEMDPDLFATLQNAIAVLESPAETATEKAHLRNTLSTSMRELDNSLDNVLTTRASAGARLNELDTVDSVAGNRMLNYDQTLSDLVDLNFVEAVSEYKLREIGLQAAQRTFVDISKLSLFNYL